MYILNAVQNHAHTYLKRLVSGMQSHPAWVSLSNKLAENQYSYTPFHKRVGNMQISQLCIYQDYQEQKTSKAEN